ncbi:germin 2-1 [Olea europaea subsp. europaea]|uniref:Germin-like protein n=1 Tax=Olea europaea subsp. europaea TaxID=158383 RepID=A0A8S0R2I3_OLEEU|nr:germin 2-1 [Olea europaea subsp. europaea]
MAKRIRHFSMVALAFCCIAFAFEHSLLQDFYVAALTGSILEGKKGDVYVFPVGLVPFQHNVGKVNVVAIVALSSQIPGVISIANTIFGSKPDISTDILAKAFQVD